MTPIMARLFANQRRIRAGLFTKTTTGYRFALPLLADDRLAQPFQRGAQALVLDAADRA